MFQTLACVCMPLGTMVEVEVHSYYVLTYVCVGSRASSARVQATVGVGTDFGLAYTGGGGGGGRCVEPHNLHID